MTMHQGTFTVSSGGMAITGASTFNSKVTAKGGLEVNTALGATIGVNLQVDAPATLQATGTSDNGLFVNPTSASFAENGVLISLAGTGLAANAFLATAGVSNLFQVCVCVCVGVWQCVCGSVCWATMAGTWRERQH